MQNVEWETTSYNIRTNYCKHVTIAEIVMKSLNATEKCVIEKASKTSEMYL